MTRRGLFGLIAGGLAACGLGVTKTHAQTKRYGPVDVSRHHSLSTRGVHLHVMHNGRDITRRCCFADDTGEGMAEVYLHDLGGKPYVRGDYPYEVAKEIVYGVTLVQGAPL